MHPTQLDRQHASQTEFVRQPVDSQSLHPAGQCEAAAKLVGIGEHPVQNESLEPAGLARGGGRPAEVGRVCFGDFARLHGGPKRLDQSTVLHPRRTRRFTTAAVEAKFEVPRDPRCQVDAAIRHGPHQVDTAAWGIVFVTGFEIRRTRGGAKSAVDAIEEPFIGNPGHWCSGGNGVVRRRNGRSHRGDDKAPRMESTAATNRDADSSGTTLFRGRHGCGMRAGRSGAELA